MQNTVTVEEVNALRSTWNAPERQYRFSPSKSFDNSDWFLKLETVKECIRPGNGATLAFVGGRGNGKTQMAVEMMKLLTSAGHSCLFTTSTGLFMEFKETFGSSATKTELEVMTKFRRPRLLIIDEFGKSTDAPWLNSLLFELLNSRHNAMKDTILIDNSTPAKFELLVGDSMASRINQGGGIIEFTWPSFR
jgi:DNA replication protein DnaC